MTGLGGGTAHDKQTCDGDQNQRGRQNQSRAALSRCEPCDSGQEIPEEKSRKKDAW